MITQSPIAMLLAGLVLGGGIGSISTWMYLMSKHAGRPVDWRTLIGSTVALLILFTIVRLM